MSLRISILSFCLLIWSTGFNALTAQSFDKVKIEKHFHEIRTLYPTDEDFSDLEAIGTSLDGVDIVMIGEQAHGDGSTFEARSRLVKYLHKELGFNVLVFESSLVDCKLVWDEIRNGADPLKVASQAVFPFWANSYYTTEVFRYIKDQLETDHPLIMAGFDAQPNGGLEAEDKIAAIEQFLKNAPDSLHLENLPRILDYIRNPYTFYRPKAYLQVDVSITENLIAELNKVSEAWNKAPWKAEKLELSRFFSNSARTLHMMWNLDFTKLDPAIANIRDEEMGRNLIWLKEKIYPNQKIIVWGASSHFGYNRQLLDPFDGMIPMGQLVKDHFGDKSYTLSITSWGGESGSVARNSIDPIAQADPETIEAFIHQLGYDYGFLNLRNKELQEALGERFKACTYGHNSWMGSWSAMTDGILYIDWIEPNRLRTQVSYNTEAAGRWKEDLLQWHETIATKHKNPFTKISEKSLKRSVDQLIRRAGMSTDEEMMVGLSRITALIGDAHTTLRIDADAIYPLGFTWFEEGLITTAAGPDQSSYLGSRLTKLGDLQIEEVIARLREIIPHENEAQIKSMVPNFLVQQNVLKGLHLTYPDSRISYEMINQSGDTLSVTVEAIPKEKFQAFRPTLTFLTPATPKSVTTYPSKYYWHELRDDGLLYIRYNSCQSDPQYPFTKFVKDVLQTLKKEKINRILVDLRYNGGGNSAVFQPMLGLLKKQKKLVKSGDIYVGIGRRTFSSAILNAVDLKQQLGATYIGEPTGGKPNHFGEVKTDQLKNCKLNFTWSVKYFKEVEGDPDSIYPDIEIAYTMADYLAGVDPVLAFLADGSSAIWQQ